MRRDFLIYKKKKRKPCEAWGGEERRKRRWGYRKRPKRKGPEWITPGSGPFSREGRTS
jgi:hypothetical protein